MSRLDNVPSQEHRLRPWARRGLPVCAAALALGCLIVAVANLGQGGWSGERTILYAAEGGLLSPRESLGYGVLFGVASLIWFAIVAGTMAAPEARSRRILRGSAMGVVIELGVAVGAGVLCGDLAGMLIIGAAVALPMILVAALARRWARFAG